MGEGAIFLLTLHGRFLVGFGIARYNHCEFFISIGFVTLNIEFKKKTKDFDYFHFTKER